jgi:4Fe-4S binding protein/cobalt chelatase family protein
VSVVRNPALEAFVAQIGDEFVLAQVLIRKTGESFELRNVADKDRSDLKAITDLKDVAQFTETGAFRPLKSAPNLRRGWRVELRHAEELGLALNYLYPGAVADWFAVRSGKPPVTNYREFAGRQTGMYRITAMLSDERAADLTRACCHRKFCLKQRLWTVPGLATDDPKQKSAIPCLEPCAIMLEFARKVMRMEQEDKRTPNLSKSELQTIIAALEKARVEARPPEVREADFDAELNPLRVELLLNKLKSGMVKER